MSTHPKTTNATDPRQPASDPTKDANNKVKADLRQAFANEDDFRDASHGLIQAWDDLVIIADKPTSQGDTREAWSLVPYAYQKDQVEAPLTVNPSLWRQSRLNQRNGLFRIIPGFYQVRAFDMSNMTIIEGKTGLIIIDPLISCECARDALAKYRAHSGSATHKDAPVVAVIFTHSHVDHFGGVLGVIEPEQLLRGEVEIIAPDGFLEHAVSENVYAGIAMSRRAQYMYGPYLVPDQYGQVDGGLGKGQSVGKVSIAAPTRLIKHTEEMLTVDGVEIVFHMTPGAEAPSEFDFYFPQHRAFCAAENAVHTMHNIQTLRGAKVRDALLWSKYMNETLSMFGGKTDVLFASHHWPIWDVNADGERTGRVTEFLTKQRDMYRYLNDQTLRMLNKGYTGIEIAEVFEMPPGLAQDWSCRGYYGSVNHNVKAVYDRYMGWFDGNPSNLHPLPPVESAAKFVAWVKAESIMTEAQRAHDAGEYRWAAEILNKLIFADPSNTEAKELQAKVLEQMGYQAEAATWRNFYLMGAQELRGSIPKSESSSSDPSMTSAMTLEMIFDAIAGHINGPQAAGLGALAFNWSFVDTGEHYLVELSNGAMTATADRHSISASATILLARTTLDGLMSRTISLPDAIREGKIKVQGSKRDVLLFFSLIEQGDPSFAIVTPRETPAAVAWRGQVTAIPTHKLSTAELAAHPVARRKLRVLGKLPRGC